MKKSGTAVYFELKIGTVPLKAGQLESMVLAVYLDISYRVLIYAIVMATLILWAVASLSFCHPKLVSVFWQDCGFDILGKN